jgi:outer membrane protein assembly factor BamB
MNPLRIFLLATLILVVFGSGEVDAVEPEWHYTQSVSSVAISADGEYIAMINRGDDVNKLFLFEKGGFSPLWSFEAQYTTENNHTENSWINAVSISGDGEFIAAISRHQLYLFNKNSSTPIWSYDGDYSPSAVDISEDGNDIIVGFSSGSKPGKDSLILFNRNSSTPLWSYQTDDNVEHLLISEDGRYIAVGITLAYKGEANKLLLFNKDNSTPLWIYTYPEDDDRAMQLAMAMSSNGSHIVVCSRATSTIHDVTLFEKNSSSPLWQASVGSIFGDEDKADHLPSIAISDNGEYIVLGSDAGNNAENSIYLLSKDSSTPLWVYNIEIIGSKFATYINSIDITPNGEYIIAGGQYRVGDDGDSKGRLYFFDKDIYTPLWIYETPATIDSVLISSDGRYISVGADKLYLFFNEDEGYSECTHAQRKVADDGFNQCICDNGEWICTDVDCTADISYNPENTNTEESSETPCQTGETKIADDGCNQCVCNDGDWMCTEMACENPEEEESLLPSVSMIPALISIGLIARYRRK